MRANAGLSGGNFLPPDETVVCVTVVLQPAIQKKMHGFITNENNFQNYNEYTYKARRKKYYIGSQKRLPKQTRNILVEKEHNLFKQQD